MYSHKHLKILNGTDNYLHLYSYLHKQISKNLKYANADNYPYSYLYPLSKIIINCVCINICIHIHLCIYLNHIYFCIRELFVFEYPNTQMWMWIRIRMDNIQFVCTTPKTWTGEFFLLNCLQISIMEKELKKLLGPLSKS